MKYVLLLSLAFSSLLSAEEIPGQTNEGWKQLSYFERHNAKYKLTRYEPPIIMKWDHIPEDAPDELKAKLPAITQVLAFRYDKFEDWYADFIKFRTKPRIAARRLTREDEREKFPSYQAKFSSDADYKEKRPYLAYTSIVASLEIQYAGQLYCVLFTADGPEPLTFFPQDAAALEDTVWRSLGRATLKYEDGIWKRDIFMLSAFPLLNFVFDMASLEDILKHDTLYNSIEQRRIAGFDPNNLPVEDSLREPYPGELTYYVIPESNFDRISHRTVTLDKITREHFLYVEDKYNGGRPYPPGFQPEREVRSFLDYDPPPIPLIPGEPNPKAENTDKPVEPSDPSEETNKASQPSRPLWAYFIFAWAILATFALIAVLTLRRK